MDHLLLPRSGGVNGGSMCRLRLGIGSECPAISLHCHTADLAPRSWLMLEACFPKPLLDGKSEPETADHLGLQTVVAGGAHGAVVAVVKVTRPVPRLHKQSKQPCPTFLSSTDSRTVTDELGQHTIEPHHHKKTMRILPSPPLLISADRSIETDDIGQ